MRTFPHVPDLRVAQEFQRIEFKHHSFQRSLQRKTSARNYCLHPMRVMFKGCCIPLTSWNACHKFWRREAVHEYNQNFRHVHA